MEGDGSLLRPSVSGRPWMMAQVSCMPVGSDCHCTKLLGTQWFSLCLGSGNKEPWKAHPGLGHWKGSLRLGLSAWQRPPKHWRSASGLSPLIPLAVFLLALFPTPIQLPKEPPSPLILPHPHPPPCHSQSVPPGAWWRGHPQLPANLWSARAVVHLRGQGPFSLPPPIPSISVALGSLGCTKPCVRWEWGDPRGSRLTFLQDTSELCQFHTQALCFTGRKDQGSGQGCGDRRLDPLGSQGSPHTEGST